MRYFRLWATWKRWDEEWLILGAEFDRTMRTFKKMEEIWTTIAGNGAETVSTAKRELEKRWELLESREEPVPRVPENEPRKFRNAIKVAEGKQAFAFAKAAFYRGMKEEAKARWQKAGGYAAGRGWEGWTDASTAAGDTAAPGEVTNADKRQRISE